MPNLGLVRELIAWLLVTLVIVDRVITMVVRRRRAAAAFLASHPNGHPTLLTLPLELRQQILKLVLDECPTLEFDGVVFIAGTTSVWLPPPILQTCQQLRLDGMKLLFSVPVCFTMPNLHAAQLINYHAWFIMMRSHYSEQQNSPFIRKRTIGVLEPQISDRSEAKKNLWQWLHAFYEEEVPGYFWVSDGKYARHQFNAFEVPKARPDVRLDVL